MYATIGVCCLLLLAAAGAEQQVRQVPLADPIRVQTVLVQVPVIVTDGRGKPVPDLEAEDFRLFQDGSPEPISFFAASKEPLKIVLMLDTSKSTVTVLDRIKKAARGFLAQLRRQDEAMIATFGGATRILRPFSSDRRLLEEALRKVEVGTEDGTRLRDAIQEITQKQLKLLDGKKAIVLLTDGQDNGSRIGTEELLASIPGTRTLIYSVFYSIDPREMIRRMFGFSLPGSRRRDESGHDGAAWQEHEREGARFLEQLSEATGGNCYRSEVADLNKTFALLADELRHQYLLGFYPEKSKLDGALHTLRIDVNRPGVAVRGRREYRGSP